MSRGGNIFQSISEKKKKNLSHDLKSVIPFC